MKQRLLNSLLLLCLTIAAILPFLASRNAEFVWDDVIMMVESARYRDPQLIAESLQKPLLFSPNYFRPAGIISLYLDARFHQMNPAGFHLTNIILHALVTLLVFSLFRQLLRPLPTILLYLATLLYAWHPVHTESICFVSSRFDLLATLFTLLALNLAWLSWNSSTHFWRITWVICAGFAVFLALGAKEMAVTTPIIVLTLWLGFMWQPSRPGNASHIHKACSFVPTIISFTAAIMAYFAVRFISLGHILQSSSLKTAGADSIPDRILLVTWSLVSYLRLLIWPWSNISPIHTLDRSVLSTEMVYKVAAIICLAGVVWIVRQCLAGKRVGWLWLTFIVSSLPVVNIIPLEIGGGGFICERFLYLPTVFFIAAGMAMLVDTGALRSWLSKSKSVGIVAGALLCLAGAYALESFSLVSNWNTEENLWLWAKKMAPESETPWINLAIKAANNGYSEVAIQYANHALTITDENPTIFEALGVAFHRQRNLVAAEDAFRKGLQLEPNQPLMWSNLASILREQNRLQEAEEMIFNEALHRDPHLWNAHFCLGNIFLSTQRPDQAVTAFETTLKYRPGSHEIISLLLYSLAAAGRGHEAVELMKTAPFVSPLAWQQLGDDLTLLRQSDAAAVAYENANRRIR